MNQAIADIRKDYMLQALLEVDVADNPTNQFTRWWNEAVSSQISEVNAMTLATATKDGLPSARIVLLKGYSEKGFIFFTNYNSTKGQELAENPRASLVFFWKELERQVRIDGDVEKVSEEESNAYYNSRPEGSRIGAWASPQSQPIESRNVIEERFKKLSDEFRHKLIERPAQWGGYIVKPIKVEFWQGRSSRLHDRIQYLLEEEKWRIQRVAP
jgi:pyridoxamine 5'-phosphate oxidase